MAIFSRFQAALSLGGNCTVLLGGPRQREADQSGENAHGKPQEKKRRGKHGFSLRRTGPVFGQLASPFSVNPRLRYEGGGFEAAENVYLPPCRVDEYASVPE